MHFLPACIIILLVVTIVRAKRNACQDDPKAAKAKAKARRKAKALANLRY